MKHEFRGRRHLYVLLARRLGQTTLCTAAVAAPTGLLADQVMVRLGTGAAMLAAAQTPLSATSWTAAARMFIGLAFSAVALLSASAAASAAHQRALTGAWPRPSLGAFGVRLGALTLTLAALGTAFFLSLHSLSGLQPYLAGYFASLLAPLALFLAWAMGLVAVVVWVSEGTGAPRRVLSLLRMSPIGLTAWILAAAAAGYLSALLVPLWLLGTWFACVLAVMATGAVVAFLHPRHPAQDDAPPVVEEPLRVVDSWRT